MAVSPQPQTAEDRVRSKAGPSEICSRQSGSGRVISASTSVFPSHSQSNNASIKSFIYYRKSQQLTMSLNDTWKTSTYISATSSPMFCSLSLAVHERLTNMLQFRYRQKSGYKKKIQISQTTECLYFARRDGSVNRLPKRRKSLYSTMHN